MNEETWVDELLPYGSGHDPLFDAVCRLVFHDRVERMQLGALDQSIAAMVFWLLRQPARHDATAALSIELPRGDHEVPILLGILAQLARIHAHEFLRGSPTDFPGSVTVMGMDTAMQRRLSKVRVEGVALSHGLEVHRVRSDGRLVQPDGGIVRFHPDARRLLYLNTRVGWPSLRGEHGGVAIVDRTSFRNPALFRRALDWSKTHRANRVIVVSDRGDTDTAEALADYASAAFHWNVEAPMRRTLAQVVGPERSRSRLSTNVLIGAEHPSTRITVIESPPIESRLRRGYELLKEAYRIDAQLPHGVAAARRVLNVVNQLVGTVESFNASAALDHRSRSIRSLARAIERTGVRSFPTEWHGYASSRWSGLRKVALELVDLVEADNPKFMGLLATVDLAARRMPDHAIVVRVASEAAAAALVDDLQAFETGLPDADHMRVLPWAERVPWTDAPTVEILPALPPPSRRSLLWSGEATVRILLTYGWEQFVLDRIHVRDVERIQRAIDHTFASVQLGRAPHFPHPTIIEFETIRAQAAARESRETTELSVSLEALTAELDELDNALVDDQDAEHTAASGRGGLEVNACPLTLEPSGEIWWVHCDAAIETLVAGGYRRRRLHDLTPGDQMIVPRGTGREDLFTRLVEAKYRDGDVRDLMLMMDRWRKACRTVIADCDGDLQRVRARLMEFGCKTLTQIEAWSDGRTIAPQHAEDIAAVARAAGDDWLEKNWRRISAAATELRGLNISIGHKVSGAMREVAHGDGPNLRALAGVLGTDAAEVLDEFDVAVLRTIGTSQTVPASQVGTVSAPFS